MPAFLKRPPLPFVEETDLPLKPLFKKGGQYIRWEKPYIYVSNVAEISHLLLPCHEPLLSSDVSVWSDLVCLCMSCGSGICTWASQSVCLCVFLWHVCHVSEYVKTQCIERRRNFPFTSSLSWTSALVGCVCVVRSRMFMHVLWVWYMYLGISVCVLVTCLSCKWVCAKSIMLYKEAIGSSTTAQTTS